jgi:hypothetical protein
MNRLARLLRTQKARLCEIANRADELYLNAELIVPGKSPRPIRVPKPELAVIQRRILENIFVDFDPHECSYGGVEGRRIEENAGRHVNGVFVIKVDLRKFYPNVHYKWVQAFFELRLGCIPPVAGTLRRLLTLDGGLPQGSCTSPALADQILRPIDVRVQNALGARGVTYTRWVDDLTFSASFSLRSWVPFIERIFKSYGLRIHKQGDKRPKQFGPREAPVVCGLSLSPNGISVPDEYLSKVKAELEMASQRRENAPSEPPPYGPQTYLGMIDYVKRFSKADGAELMRTFRAVPWKQLLHLDLPSKKGKVIYIADSD